MAYIVLARRWRPQQFEEIIGQEHISKTLANAIESKHIGHAFIFSGPRGVGKTTTARILAKALNCEKGPLAKPCSECSNCISITKGNSLDVLEIDGASNRGIDEIRNLRENIRFTPSQGKYRIYIIDEVHMLTKEAFNALLKTLEEPPEHALFIFATTEIHRVPATILSRCQRFDFKRIPVKTIIEHLKHICSHEKIEIEDDATLQIAKKADGSMRDAQSILDQIISFAGEKVSLEQVAKTLGIISLDLYFDITDKIKSRNTKEIILASQTVISSGYDLGEFLNGFEEHLRNLLLVIALNNLDLINVSEQYHEKYLAAAKNFSEADLLNYIQQIGEIQNAIKWSIHPQIKFELGLLKMVKMPQTVAIETILEKLNLLKKKKNNLIAQSPELLTLQSIQDYWEILIESFKINKVNLANAMELGHLKSFRAATLEIEYKKIHSFHENWIRKNVRLLEESFKKQFKQMIKIELITVDSGESNSEDTHHVLKKVSEDDPLINTLIDELGLELN
jgi:DNA polymerase-3 subunit gamma/tau